MQEPEPKFPIIAPPSKDSSMILMILLPRSWTDDTSLILFLTTVSKGRCRLERPEGWDINCWREMTDIIIYIQVEQKEMPSLISRLVQPQKQYERGNVRKEGQ
jgi:hypothetical protein